MFPLPASHTTRRLVQLTLGLMLYGLGSALMVRSNLGLSPWHVFHAGVSHVSGLSFGMVVNLTGALLLLLWIPLRQRLGIGTIMNVLIIGTTADLSLMVLPVVHSLPVKIMLLIAAILLIAVASGAYIGAGFEPGPRDGLMTGMVRLTGWSVKQSRTVIEVAIMVIGILLGGQFGFGTFAYALLIGPLVQIFLAIFDWRSSEGST